jgi:hypothetical protein
MSPIRLEDIRHGGGDSYVLAVRKIPVPARKDYVFYRMLEDDTITIYECTDLAKLLKIMAEGLANGKTYTVQARQWVEARGDSGEEQVRRSA